MIILKPLPFMILYLYDVDTHWTEIPLM